MSDEKKGCLRTINFVWGNEMYLPEKKIVKSKKEGWKSIGW